MATERIFLLTNGKYGHYFNHSERLTLNLFDITKYDHILTEFCCERYLIQTVTLNIPSVHVSSRTFQRKTLFTGHSCL